MDFQEFEQKLGQETLPDMDPMLQALWYDAKGNWDQAHHIVQEIDSDMASCIHAYLHRKEGDLGNAGYWYRRAGRSTTELDLQAEWEQLVRELL